MIRKRIPVLLAPLLLSFGAAEEGAKKSDKKPAAIAKTDAPASRLVRYRERDVVPIKAKLRHATLIVLPEDEKILDFIVGDRDFWVVEGVQNFAYIKPSKESAQSNLNLITAAGNVYSFSLHEISKTEGAKPDLKIFVQPAERSTLARITAQPRFVPADQVRVAEQRLAEVQGWAERTAADAREEARKQSEDFQTEYPFQLDFGYEFDQNRKPFRVSTIYTDSRFTYIRADPQETPALYELRDGKPSLIEFDFRDGLYVIPKILNRGYLAIGKKKFPFRRKEQR